MKTNDKYVAFDLDGTLIDSFDTIVANCCTACNIFGVDISDFDFESFRYVDLKDLFSDLTGRYNIDFIRFKSTFDKVYLENYFQGTHIIDSSLRILNRYKDNGYKIIVLTNKNQKVAERICNKLFGKNCIDIVVGRLDSLPIKPWGNILQRLNDYGIGMNSVESYFGDSETDSEVAAFLGINYCKVI